MSKTIDDQTWNYVQSMLDRLISFETPKKDRTVEQWSTILNVVTKEDLREFPKAKEAWDLKHCKLAKALE